MLRGLWEILVLSDCGEIIASQELYNCWRKLFVAQLQLLGRWAQA